MTDLVLCRLSAASEVLDELKDDDDPCDFNRVAELPRDLRVKNAYLMCEAAAKRALLDILVVKEIDDPRAEFERGNFRDLAAMMERSNMFNVQVTPSPLDFDDEQWEVYLTMQRNRRLYGHYYWESWCVEHWGTKWNAVEAVRKNDGRLVFKTAWSPPIPVLRALSRRCFGRALRLEYWHENDESCAAVQFRNGEHVEIPIGDSKAFWRSLNAEFEENS